MVTYSNKHLTYGLAYYGEPYRTRGVRVDVIKEEQYGRKRFYSLPHATMLIDLSQSESSIFDCFEKNTKYEINRARNKDGIRIRDLDPATERARFYGLYAEFASAKGLRQLGTRETDLLFDNGLFGVRVAESESGETLVMHSYITANGRARLAHSASLFRESADNASRNLIGRANRLLHWDDILHFKGLGFSVYDLGGIDTDEGNAETQSINRFKECFGGTVVTEYNSLVPVSVKGLFFVAYKKMRG